MTDFPKLKLLVVALSYLCHQTTFAFTLSTQFTRVGTQYSPSSTFMSSKEHNYHGDDADLNIISNANTDRRTLFKSAAAAMVSSNILLSSSMMIQPASAAEDNINETSMGSDAAHPIVVIGAGGKVGTICTKILSSTKNNLYTRAVTRSGRQILPDVNGEHLSYASGDVTNYESIKRAIQGASGVIFAASASGKKKGGDPAHVDYLGVYNTAKACLECGVPKLVVVSAASVTRPDSAGFKATNFFVKYIYGEKIMDYKIAGEEILKDLYAQQPKLENGQVPCSYSIVRPGGLSDGKAEGPSAVCVSQGDVYAAEISREDVAEISVAALLKGKATDFTTFEFNNIKGLAKIQDNLNTPPDALVHSGAQSYSALLDGLLTDDEMAKSYGNYLSGFKGDKIEPVSSLA